MSKYEPLYLPEYTSFIYKQKITSSDWNALFSSLVTGHNRQEMTITDIKTILDINLEAIDNINEIIDGIDERFNIIKESIDIINERLNGVNKALSFDNYEEMVSSLNTLASTECYIGQNIMIITLEVPDLWVSEIAPSSINYTYTSDTDFVEVLRRDGKIQIGYYVLSALETQKVDLTNYVKNTNYATEYVSASNPGKFGLVLPANGLRIDSFGRLTTDRTTAGINNSQYIWTKTKFIDEINNGNSNTAVTVGTLGVAVKAALLNPGTFKADGAQGNYPTEWTEDEQELAQKTLGIANYVKATTQPRYLYGTDTFGNQKTIGYTNAMSSNTIVQRNPDGSIQTIISSGDYHAVNNLRMIAYVNEVVESMLATNEDIDSILGGNSYLDELNAQADEIIEQQESLIGGE